MTQLGSDIEDLLVDWEQRRRAGGEVSPEELCRDCPELLDPLRQRIAALKATDWLFRAEPPAAAVAEKSGPQFPARLGDYQILDRIGAGGMGTVYRARHCRLDKLVALKILPHVSTWDIRAVGRFEREMKAIGRLEHPHIVAAHDAGDIDGTHYLAMQLIDGVDVARLQDDGDISIAQACEITRQAALGLHYAHEQGLIHRDVKPSNLMLGCDGTVRVLDLGLARIEASTGTGDDELSTTGHAMGTVDYMAPEQYDDTGTVGHRADIYGLGATLYKLLTGHSPLDPTGEASRLQRLQALSAGRVEPIESHRDDLPEELASLVNRMLSRNADERPATAAAVAGSLVPFAAESGVEHLATRATSGHETLVDTGTEHATLNELRRAERHHSPGGSVRPGVAVAGLRRQTLHHSPGRWFAGLLTVLAVLAAGAVIYVKTDNGTLVVRAGEGVTVEVFEDAGVRLVHKRTGQEYDVRIGRHPQKAGEYTILVKQQPTGLEFSATEFRIGRGEDEELRVTFKSPDPSASMSAEPSTVSPAPAKLDADPRWNRQSHQKGHGAVLFLPEGSLISCGADGVVRQWQVGSGESEILLETTGPLGSLALLPDGKTLVLGGTGAEAVQFLNLETRKIERSFRGGRQLVTHLDASQDGRTLLSSSRQALLIRDLDSGDSRQVDPFSARRTMFHSDGKHAVGIRRGNRNQQLKVVDLESAREIGTIDPSVRGFTLTSDRTRVILVEVSGGIIIRDLDGNSIEIAAFCERPIDPVASPNGDLFALGDGNGETIALYDIARGEQIGVLANDGRETVHVAFSHDGQRVASIDLKGRVRLWQLPRLE